MILQSLVEYYERKRAEIPAFGYDEEPIPFLVTLTSDGRFAGLSDTRYYPQGQESADDAIDTPSNKKGKRTKPKLRTRVFSVPTRIQRSSGSGADKAYTLWDHPGYVFGVVEEVKTTNRDTAEQIEAKQAKAVQKAARQHAAFIRRIRTLPEPASQDAGIQALLRFLESGDFRLVFEHPLWKEVAAMKNQAKITFDLEGAPGLICQRPLVQESVATLAAAAEANNVGEPDTTTNDPDADPESSSESGPTGTCLLTGKFGPIARIHPSIHKVMGAHKAGATFVSFNCKSFESFGFSQGFNAPISINAAVAYTSAANHLLRSRQHLRFGGTSTIFWADEENPLEDGFVYLFGPPPGENPEQQIQAMRTLFAAPATGQMPVLDDPTPFHVLTIGAHSTRLTVRYSRTAPVGEFARNIHQHFQDTEIAHREDEYHHLTMYHLLLGMAPSGRADNIADHDYSLLFQAILNNQPYPHHFLSAALERSRAERTVSYERAAIIKAFLTRQHRILPTSTPLPTVSLDRSNANIGYLCGRLFAVLEQIQYHALGKSTVRNQYFVSAVSNPEVGLTPMMGLSGHHLRAIKSEGLRINLEKEIHEITDQISDFPTFLDIAEQARFNLGYYHQQRFFFDKYAQSKKRKKATEEAREEATV